MKIGSKFHRSTEKFFGALHDLPMQRSTRLFKAIKLIQPFEKDSYAQTFSLAYINKTCQCGRKLPHHRASMKSRILQGKPTDEKPLGFTCTSRSLP
jgi:hypothetical protein